MKAFLLSILFIFLGVAFFVWILQHVGFENVVDALSTFPWWGIIIVIALTFISFWIGVLRWQRILNHQGIVIAVPM